MYTISFTSPCQLRALCGAEPLEFTARTAEEAADIAADFRDGEAVQVLCESWDGAYVALYRVQTDLNPSLAHTGGLEWAAKGRLCEEAQQFAGLMNSLLINA